MIGRQAPLAWPGHIPGNQLKVRNNPINEIRIPEIDFNKGWGFKYRYDNKGLINDYGGLVQVSSSSESASAGLNISFGTASQRIQARETEEQLRSNLDYIYQEIVIIRSAFEQINNPLDLDSTKINNVKAASAGSSADLGLTRGTTDDADKTLSSIAQFSSMSSGTVTINNVDISIDVTVDSLNDVIARINASAAGVTSSLFNVDQRFMINANSAGQSLTLNSRSTGFFPALNMDDGASGSSFGAKESLEKTVMPQARAARIAEAIEDFAVAFNKLFDENKLKAENDSPFEDFLETLRDDLKTAVQEGFGSTMTDVDSGYGLAFDFGSTANRVFDFTLLDKMDLVKKLSKEGSEVNELFFGLARKDDDGLIEKILKSLETHEDFLKGIKGTTGIFVDTSA